MEYVASDGEDSSEDSDAASGSDSDDEASGGSSCSEAESEGEDTAEAAQKKPAAKPGSKESEWLLASGKMLSVRLPSPSGGPLRWTTKAIAVLMTRSCWQGRPRLALQNIV